MGNFAELYLLTIWGLERTYPFTIIHPSSRKYDRMRATRKIMGFIFVLEYRNRWPYISSKMFFLRLYIRKEIYYTTIIPHQVKKIYLNSDIVSYYSQILGKNITYSYVDGKNYDNYMKQL